MNLFKAIVDIEIYDARKVSIKFDQNVSDTIALYISGKLMPIYAHKQCDYRTVKAIEKDANLIITDLYYKGALFKDAHDIWDSKEFLWVDR